MEKEDKRLKSYKYLHDLSEYRKENRLIVIFLQTLLGNCNRTFLKRYRDRHE